MKGDSEIIAALANAFASCKRPVRFLPDVGDPEFEDHEALLQARDLDTLEQDDLSPSYDAFVYCNPEGLAYFLPVLAVFALRVPSDALAWFGPQLFFYLSPDKSGYWFASHCSPEQARVVLELLEHVESTRLELVQNAYAEAELRICLSSWRSIRQ